MMYYTQTNSCNEELSDLLKGNIQYSIMCHVLKTNCEKIVYSEDRTLIIMHSDKQHPIWIWCTDTNENNIVTITKFIKEYCKGRYSILLSKEVLDKLKDYDSYFNDVEIKDNLVYYQLDEVNDILYKNNCKVSIAKMEDIDSLVKLTEEFYTAIGGGDMYSIDDYKRKVIDLINNKKIYKLTDNNGKIVSIANIKEINQLGYISGVVTTSEERGKGYGTILVHSIARDILMDNKVPALCAEGDNPISNKCYQNIGFYKVGELYEVYK